MATGRGSGSMRERRPGVWEIRIANGADALGRTRQRSTTVRGSRDEAELLRAQLAEAAADGHRFTSVRTVGELLETWLGAEHTWRPSTWTGYRSNARHLRADPIAAVRPANLTPRLVRQAMARWQAAGATPSVLLGRFKALQAALGWAYDERLIDAHPLRGMRGPRRVEPRRPVADDDVAALLRTADAQLLEAVANDAGGRRAANHRHRAEQDLLLARLAADSGARRGELVVLRFEDLAGRVLRIQRGVSGSTITAPKSGRPRSLTLGTGTARLWHTLEADWRARNDHRPFGPWVFSGRLDHATTLTAGALGHRFARLRDRADVEGASLHRLRHSVATFLVARGEILQAQARLGHADASTTLREYAYALPLADGDIADRIDRHLDGADDTALTQSRLPSD